MFKKLFIWVVLVKVTFFNFTFASLNFSKDLSLNQFDFDTFQKKFTEVSLTNENWPEYIEHKDRKYLVDYTFNDKLTRYIKKQLRRYRSDYTSVVVIDNNTGAVLSAIDYTRSTSKFGKKLSFSTTNPAASIFKVVTAADLLENTDISDETDFYFNGRSTTLYKNQLRDKKNRWTRKQKFKRAFARSNNVVFGKAAQKKTSISSLFSTAHKFGFNDDLMQVLDFGSSQVFDAKTTYNLAELASGFNRGTMISPLHGAVISSVVANNGVLKRPYIVKKISNAQNERVEWSSQYVLKRVISKDTVYQLQNMMRLTVKRGTARGAFRPHKTRLLKHIEIGGKTGSITGGLPHGKRDWFVSYAKPKEGDDLGISICVMIVNVKKWYIKSPYLAKKIIQYYYNVLSRKSA